MIYPKASISIRLFVVVSLTIYLFPFFQTGAIASGQKYCISESVLFDNYNIGHIYLEKGNLIGAFTHFQFIYITLSSTGWKVTDPSFKNELKVTIDELAIQIYRRYEEGLALQRRNAGQKNEYSTSKGEVRPFITGLRRNLPLR